MLAKLLNNTFNLFMRNELVYKYSLILEIVSINISLYIYYYTSQSFKLDTTLLNPSSDSSYFSYIVIGELFISMPIFLFDGMFRKVKEALAQGVWLTYSILPISKYRILFNLMFSALPKELLRIGVTLLCAMIFFKLEMTLSSIIYASIVTMILAPIFLSFGIILSVLLVKTGRGQGALSYVNTFLTIGAGAYFPLSVLPEALAKILSYSPLTFILESIRNYNYTNDYQYFSTHFFSIAPWYIFVPIALFSVNKYLKGYENIKEIVLRV